MATPAGVTRCGFPQATSHDVAFGRYPSGPREPRDAFAFIRRIIYPLSFGAPYSAGGQAYAVGIAIAKVRRFGGAAGTIPVLGSKCSCRRFSIFQSQVLAPLYGQGFGAGQYRLCTVRCNKAAFVAKVLLTELDGAIPEVNRLAAEDIRAVSYPVGRLVLCLKLGIHQAPAPSLNSDIQLLQIRLPRMYETSLALPQCLHPGSYF